MTEQLKKADDVGQSMLEALASAIKLTTAGKAGQSSLASGKIFATAGFLVEALDCYKCAIEEDKSNYEAMARLSLMQLRVKDIPGALETALHLAEKAPEYSFPEMATKEKIGALTVLGNALLANGQLDDAKRSFKKAVSINPKDSTASARLAQVYLMLGETKKALSLESDFKNNSRFARFSEMLNVGRENPVILSPVRTASFLDKFAVDVHGRPFVNDGDVTMAEVVNSSAWIGDN